MIKTKKVRRTITGSVACALLLGSFAGGVFTKQAYAADASPLINQHLNSIVRDTAWIADKDEAGIFSALKQGQSLAEASGLKASDLSDRLNSLLNEDINHYYEDSDVDSAEIEALKSQGANAIAMVVSEKGYKPASEEAAVNLQAVIQDQLRLVVSNASAFADVDSEDVQQRVRAGETVVEASGLAHSDLISKLTVLLNQSIDSAVGSQHIAASVVRAAKEQGARQLNEAITTPGFEPAASVTEADVTSAVYGKLDSIIGDVSLIADKEYLDITDALQNGSTLVEASGLSESGLYNQLAEAMDAAIGDAAAPSSLTDEKLNEVKNEAHKQIKEIINTPGYTAVSSAAAESLNKLVKQQLDQAVALAASLADKDQYDVENAVKQGASLANATGMNGTELTQKLLSSLNQYIDANSTNVDAEAVAKAKQSAAQYINSLVLSGLSAESAE